MARLLSATREFFEESKLKEIKRNVGPWITLREVAILLDTSPDKINYHARKGRFLRKKIDNRWFYSRRYVNTVVKHWWNKFGLD